MRRNLAKKMMQLEWKYKIYSKIVTYCFDSLAIRLWSKDLKHLIPGTGPPGLQG